MVFRRGGDREDKAAVAAGGDIEAREVVVFVNSRKTDDRYWKRQRTTYCTERADEPILPPPPAGYVWADALSGWVARRNVGQCLTSPNGDPKVMRLLSTANATAAAHAIWEEVAAAEQACRRGQTHA